MTQTEVIKPGPAPDMPLKWFMFSQNNSGGSYVENDVVCVERYVGIQARNAAEAIRMAQHLFEPYSDYCPCCGERLSYYVDDCDGTDVPSIYGESIYEAKKPWIREKVILHYADGKVERVTLKEKDEE